MKIRYPLILATVDGKQMGDFAKYFLMFGEFFWWQVTKLIPSNALVIDEKTWMVFPYVRTTITIPFFNKVNFATC